MIRAVIFDCFGVLVVDSTIGLRLDDDMLTFVGECQKRFKTAVLSNISREGLNRHLANANQAAYFDLVIATGEELVAKPDPAVFLLAVDRLDILPEEAVMIDDSIMHCEGARIAGLHAIQFRSLRQLREDMQALTDAQK